MSNQSASISFRLDESTTAVLDDYCKRSGLSRGAACRSLVINSLAGGDPVATTMLVEECLQQLARQQALLQSQRRSLPYLLYAILTEIGRQDAATAAEVVRSTFAKIPNQELS
jgi:hypothetical protein